MVWELIVEALEWFYEDLTLQYLTEMQTVFSGLFRSAFFLESAFGVDQAVLSPAILQQGYRVIYGVCLMLFTIKLLTKGWSIYILWRDGDPEVPPGDLLTGAGWAVIVAVGFPLIYEIAVDVVFYLVDTVLAVFPAGVSADPFTITGSTGGNLLEDLQRTFSNYASFGGFTLFAGIGYIIAVIILFFQMLGRGAELLVYRLGVPIAAVGLINSDGGAWNNYLQLLLKQMFTSMIQYFCLALSMRVLSSVTLGSIVVGIALEVAAFSAPKLLSSVLTPKGGGGFGQKVSTVAMVVRTFVK